MRDQAERMEDDMRREDKRRPDTDRIPLSEWTEGKFLDWENPPYDYSAEVWCYWDGCELSATGYYSCRELQEVKDIEITGRD